MSTAAAPIPITPFQNNPKVFSAATADEDVVVTEEELEELLDTVGVTVEVVIDAVDVVALAMTEDVTLMLVKTVLVAAMVEGDDGELVSPKTNGPGVAFRSSLKVFDRKAGLPLSKAVSMESGRIALGSLMTLKSSCPSSDCGLIWSVPAAGTWFGSLG